ncbi:hypothetical protein BSKO_01343 [Bryopsis sp. KO-2023]|nr:hypothetical protein BSKO_01343 [Bryopsis sp. KO-2023]
MSSQCAGSNCAQVRPPRQCARRRVSCASSAAGRPTTSTTSGCEKRSSRRDVLHVAAAAAALPFSFSKNAWAAVTQEEGETIYIDLERDTKLSPAQKQVLLNNLKIQRQNRVPEGFPSFVREGFDIKVLASGFTQDESGLIYKDYKIGDGPYPQDEQQVTFEYTGFNESGARIDSTYLKGYPAQTRLGLNGLIPGFELALKSMRVGGQRRVIIPPELGPPVGPQTFFSAKQCEVFDIELTGVKSCRRTQFAMFSGVTCE